MLCSCLVSLAQLTLVLCVIHWLSSLTPELRSFKGRQSPAHLFILQPAALPQLELVHCEVAQRLTVREESWLAIY